MTRFRTAQAQCGKACRSAILRDRYAGDRAQHIGKRLRTPFLDLLALDHGDGTADLTDAGFRAKRCHHNFIAG